MNIHIESCKTFERAMADLQRSVAARSISMRYVVDRLRDTLASQEQPVDKQTMAMEGSNARAVSQVLSRDPTISRALPVRVAGSEHIGSTQLEPIMKLI